MVAPVVQKFFRCASKSPFRHSLHTSVRELEVPSARKSVPEEITADTQHQLLKTWVAPLADLPYPDQLNLKQSWVSYVISQYESIFYERCKILGRTGSPPKPQIQTICPSPSIEKYRNKDSYVVRKGFDGNPKTVGHIVGNTSKSDTSHVCVPPIDVLSPSKHVEVAKAFQEYIEMSSLPACHHFSDGGFWKSIIVRTNSVGDTMLLVDVHPRDMTEKQLLEEQNHIRGFFVDGPGARCGLKSLYFQACPHTRCNRNEAPLHLLHGESHLIESLHGRNFALSPTSFFQINREVAEIMYQHILKFGKLKPVTMLLDLCCGIGVVSIVASSWISGSVGIDVSEDAIMDARKNMSVNKVHTGNFYSGRVEDILPKLLDDLTLSPHIVAVLNPGRGGVYKGVVEALRKMQQIQTLIYVSCQPNHVFVVENIIKLIIPSGKRNLGTPFKLSRVIPLDMFPQTNHCEVIFCFTR